MPLIVFAGRRLVLDRKSAASVPEVQPPPNWGKPHMGTPLDDAPELCRLDVASLAAGYVSGTFSPVDVAEAAIARAEAVQGRFNAFSMIDADNAIAAARFSEARWRAGKALSPIDGMPTTIKDIVWVEGWPVSFGSRSIDQDPCDADAPSVALLRRAGAVFIAQTTMPEFGWKAVTDSPRWGMTLNPWNREKTAGGSSGGAAVAAATGAGVLHLGTDGGGSIRIPATFCGVVGFKPTYGRVPAYPLSVFGAVAHIGPIARTVEDTRTMLNAMSGRDLRDWTQPVGLPELSARDDTFAGKKIGYWSSPPVGSLDPDISLVVRRSVALLEELGAVVEPVELRDMDLLSIFHAHWLAGAAKRLSTLPEALHRKLDPGFVDAAHAGARYSLFDYMEAQSQRASFGAFMDSLLARYDLVVSPGVSISPFEAGFEVPAESGMARWTQWASFSFPINLSQQPACVVPCGFTPNGLPASVQFVGARGEDADVLMLAKAFEDALRNETGARNLPMA